jgi:hypothetical protein
LRTPPQDEQGGTAKVEKSILTEVGVPVWQRGGVQSCPGRVAADQVVLEIRPPARRRASYPPDKVETSVEVDHRPAPGRLVQAVDILGEEKLALAFSFELGEGVMRIVGLGPSEPSPADHAARPIASASDLVGHECLKADRPRSFPVAVVVMIIGDTRVRAARNEGGKAQRSEIGGLMAVPSDHPAPGRSSLQPAPA